MINTEDQEALFKLISNYLKKDIHCIAIGGTAMMIKNYKNTTKDIDLVFKNEKDRESFISAIKELGYKERSLKTVYDIKRSEHKNKPLMYTRGEERFDLFTKDVFGYEINFEDDIKERLEFLSNKELIIEVLSTEQIILLKSITNREKDYEDIETILKIQKIVDWDYIIEEAINQRKNNEWILYELEETLQKLKEKTLIKKKYFDKIYSAEEKFIKK